MTLKVSNYPNILQIAYFTCNFRLSLQFFLLLILTVSGISALPDHPAPIYSPVSYASSPASAYNFAWAVADDYSQNNYGHQETRDAQTTSGEYHVAMPDGRTQVTNILNHLNVGIYISNSLFPLASY
jgi:hypothetical protein